MTNNIDFCCQCSNCNKYHKLDDIYKTYICNACINHEIIIRYCNFLFLFFISLFIFIFILIFYNIFII